MRSSSRASFVLAALLVALSPAVSLAGSPEPPPGGEMTTPASLWDQVDERIEKQQLEAASELVEEILAGARSAGASDDWTRALVARMQLRTALHGYETAVEDLRVAEWPPDPAARGLLHLVLAQAYAGYLDVYGWEIGQRETVASGEATDLDAMSREQIAAAADRAYLAAWSEREAWGRQGLGDLARYFETGTYPVRIRGTRRDVVTTLWTEWLANTSHWSPRASNEIHRLDLAALAAGDGEAPGEAAADPDVHPLARLAFLFGDLERWHRAGDRPEASFEAARARLEVLWNHFDADEDRAALRERLRERIDALDPSLPWRAMGQWTLARWIDATDAPDRRIRAREVALEGARSHPESPGGRACRALVAEIEAPDAHLEAMTRDAPGRRSIGVSHRNLDRLHFRAWRLDLEEVVAAADDWNLLPRWREIPDRIMVRAPDASWAVELPPTPDFRHHRTWVTPPTEEKGLWIVASSVREDFGVEENRRSAVHLLLTDLVVEARTAEPFYEVGVLDGPSGRPVAGASVELWRLDYRGGHRRVVTGTTDGDGRVRLLDRAPDRANHFLLVAHGDDRALLEGLSEGYPHTEQTTRGALVYTDRAVYRPGQTLHWKVVAYQGKTSEGRFEVLAGAAGTVSLLDANGEEVASVDATTNEFGSASGTLPIAPGRLLGAWRLQTTWNGVAGVRVEEYVRPTFEVSVLDPVEELRLGREARLLGEARYYFGLPVTEGDVDWRVTREPQIPPWWRWWGWSPPVSSPQIVASGSAALDVDGRFEVAFVPEADERDADRPGLSYRYRLEADVTELGGETRTGERIFRLGFVAIQALVTPDREVGREDEGLTVRVERTDLDGNPRAGEGRWVLSRVVLPERALLPAERPAEIAADEEPWATPGDRLRPRWVAEDPEEAITREWPSGEELARGSVEHGDDGLASIALPGLAGGLYRIVYTTEDRWGETFEITRDLRIAGEAVPVGLAALLEVERDTVEPGGTARLVFGSGIPGQRMTLELSRGGELFDRRSVEGGGALELLEIPVGPDLRGGFTARLTVVRDHQRLERVRHVQVPWADRRLDVEFATFRDRLRPGQRETWRVTVRGADEEALAAGSAELLASMFDRSLDLFAPYDPPAVEGLYPSRLGAVAVQVGLGHQGEVWADARSFGARIDTPVLQPPRLTAISGYGIGGPGRRGRMMQMRLQTAAMSYAESVPAPAAPMALEERLDVAEKEAFAAEAPPPPPPPGGGEGGADGELRTDFAETAFWLPHLVVGEDGAVAFEFEVPDSVTDWHVWVHSVTRDLRGGSLHRTTRTVKDLQVRPSLPRFLRQGDRAEIEVVIDNAGEIALAGAVVFDVIDPESGESAAAAFGLDDGERSFELEPGRSTSVSFRLAAPERLGAYAVVARARAGDLSDGERRPLPILPSRFQLIRSRFAALSDQASRTLRFDDLVADDDPSRIDERLVVTVDAQLFQTVLRALPYLAEYPYECTEQTLNRFLSAAIVSSVFAEHPAVAAAAGKAAAARETRLEPWEEDDPNRRMLLVETPWAPVAAGGTEDPDRLIRLLDPVVAAAQRQAALAELEKAQTSSGGFPWWPGGPPSPYLTVYLLQGLSRAIEVGVEPPRETVRAAWGYLHRHYLDEIVDDMVERDCCWELVTFLRYVLSAYPDDDWTGGVFTAAERAGMLEHSFRHWRDHSPLLKALLALTLHREGRGEDAALVFDSVMDSAKADPDLGTFWAPEDRAWLWYNDTVETHAIALRTLSELDPDDPRRTGLVQWLLLDKKLGHWKSTRATAEAIYALVHSLDRDGLLGERDVVRVELGDVAERFVFEPDDPTTRARVVLEGEEIRPEHGTIRVERETEGLVFASATWHFSTERLPDEGDGDLLAVDRTFFRRVLEGDRFVLHPLAEGDEVRVGDEVEVRLVLRARHAAEYVHLRDPRGAGFEPVSLRSGYSWEGGVGYYEEVRDSGASFFFDRLPAGEVTFRHRLRAATAGTFRVAPAKVQSMYAPEFAAHSAGRELVVAPR